MLYETPPLALAESQNVTPSVDKAETKARPIDSTPPTRDNPHSQIKQVENRSASTTPQKYQPPNGGNGTAANYVLDGKNHGPSVVIVDSDNAYRRSFMDYLQSQGFAVRAFANPTNALENFRDLQTASAIVVATDLLDMTGIEFLQRARTLGLNNPVAFLSEGREQIHEEVALEYGASDFFRRSRSVSILAHRIRLLINGVKSPHPAESDANDTISLGELILNLESHRAYWKDVCAPLTVTQFRIVRLLAERAGEAVTYREIYDVVHGNGFVAGDGPDGFRMNVRSLIRNVRNRFRDIDPGFKEIMNRAGVGYSWRRPAETDGARHALKESGTPPCRPNHVSKEEGTDAVVAPE